MTLDMYSECSSLNTSPRLSFSHNLIHQDSQNQNQTHPIRLDSSLLESNSNPDFDFCLANHNTTQSIHLSPPATADELFSQGQILPLQLQQRFTQPPPIPSTHSKNEIYNQESSSKEIIISNQNQPNSSSKSFWKIKRSSSLHVDNTYKKTSFWSSLPLLSRSNSTGSVPSQKQRQPKNSSATSTTVNSSSFYMYTLSQKPPLKRNYGGGVGYGNGSVRINPVLNVPPHFISKGTATLFGLGSLFGNGKDKKNKK